VVPQPLLPCLALLLLASSLAASAQGFSSDLCVYGGTSGGVAAAVTAARLGKSVILIAQNNHVGGMTSGGLGVTDVGQQGSIGGISREFYRRVGQHYGSSDAVYWFEPRIAESVFWQMLNEAGVRVFTNERITSVTMTNQRIAAITMESSNVFRAKMFIDTTYEGDLIALAGVSFTVGREGTSTYNESLAGVRAPGGSYSYDPYFVPGNPVSGLLPLMQSNTLGATGPGDHRVQAYNFRLCLTQNATNRVSLTSNAPPNYSEANYELAARYIEARLAADGAVSLGQLIHIQQLIPNQKTDINANNELSTDFVGASYTWATNTHTERDAIRQQHEDYTRGLLYFFGTSPRVPANVRAEMQMWGLAKDEFTDTAGWPHQLYVREARRMVSDYIMRQQNCDGREFAPEPIGLASYAMDSHAIARVPSGGLARSEGGFFVNVPQPFPISYRSLMPRTGECQNVFATFALSASHVAFASCRMEPVFMITSQSAATAAAFAIDDNVPVQQVNYAKLAAQLRADGQLLDWVGGTLTTNGVILDNGNAGVAQIGSWTVGANAGFWGTSYLHDQSTGKGTKSVRYTPNLPFTGAYDVYAWWVAAGNRPTNTPYDIIDASGTNTVLVNQQVNGSQWVFLLRTNFIAGQSAEVIIRNGGTAAGTFVIADAVRFMPVGSFTVPPPIIDLIASDAVAGEFETNRGRFTLVRSGDTSAALIVSYNVSGAAANGVDFVALPGSATFSAGSNAAIVLITPLVDAAPEKDETVTLTLLSGAGWQLGALTNATVVLRDAPPPMSLARTANATDVWIEFVASPDHSYIIERSAFLTPNSWQRLTNIAAASDARTIRITNSVGSTNHQFFRLATP
jgi:hypothetical protein